MKVEDYPIKNAISLFCVKNGNHLYLGDVFSADELKDHDFQTYQTESVLKATFKCACGAVLYLHHSGRSSFYVDFDDYELAKICPLSPEDKIVKDIIE